MVTLCGQLTATEKATVVASGSGYKTLMAGALNIDEMLSALNHLAPPLAVKLEWIDSTVMFTLSINYSKIKSLITTAPQGELDVLKTEQWKNFFVKVCDNQTMVEALNDLKFDLVTKLTWLEAEMTITQMELNYATVKPWIVAAPQGERDALKTEQWKNFFVKVCDNQTMVEALGDLMFDLSTKLTWLIAEGGDYAQVKQMITLASVAEKNTALANQAMLNKLKGHFSWDEFAKSIELLGRICPVYGTLTANASVQAAIQAAWTASNPSIPSATTTQHEEGGWVYMNIITGSLSVVRASAGTKSS